MPAPSLQSRIDAFESLARRSPSQIHPKSPPKSPSNLLEAPISPTASSFASISPFRASQTRSRSPSASPPVLGRKTSLIDLKDWVMDDGFSSPSFQNGSDLRWNGKPNGANDFGSSTPSLSHGGINKIHSTVSTSPSSILINFESPHSQPIPIKAPPLPPRKTSYTSLKSVSSSNSTSTRNGGSVPPFKRSDSLTVEHTYPPLSKLDALDFSRKGGHVPASSISSFHSVSLSSDGGTTDGGTTGPLTNHVATFPMDRDVDTVSLDDSFEDVAASSIASPTTAAALAFNWDTPKPPKLPQRPSSKQSNHTSPPPSSPKPPTRPPSSTSPSRRVPPPPPRISSRGGSARTSFISTTTSDRSSIFSTSTATTSHTSMSSTPASGIAHKSSLARPTPVPAAARKRYENVFVANVLQQRRLAAKPATLSPFAAKKARQAAGWRGLSVDLITNPENNSIALDGKANGNTGTSEAEDTASLDGKLDGYIVKLVWSTSRLDRERLRAIWDECDTSRDGALDRDAFVKGMWRIDEELRRAQTKTSGKSHTPRLPKSTVAKPILR